MKLQLQLCCCFHFKASHAQQKRRVFPQGAANVSFKVCASFSNNPAASFKIFPARYFLWFLALRGVKAELSQRRLYCNQLFSPSIQTPDRGIPVAHHRPNQTL